MQPSPNSCVRILDIRGDVHPSAIGNYRPGYPIGPESLGGLSFTMRSLFEWMQVVAQRGGVTRPEMLSACRDSERQRFLQREWDEGRREGLAVRPVDNSKHTPDVFGVCRAFDLANDLLWLETMGHVVAQKWPNIEWGGTYLPPDLRHFEER